VHALSYVILVFGIIGIGLGLYGLFMPMLRRRGLILRLPSLKLPARPSRPEEEQLESVLAELESSGFRSSAFQAPEVPALLEPTLRVVHVPAAPGESDSAAEVDDGEGSLQGDLDLSQDEEPAEPPLEASSPEPPEPEAEPQAEESAVAAADGLDPEMMALFAEVAAKSTTPEALRDAIPEVEILDLLAEARAVRQMLSGGDSVSSAA
jgi:hypothetical protein